MLYLIGLGLYDEKDMTLRGLELARECKHIYLEKYTSVLTGATKEDLEKLIGKPITELERAGIEENPGFLREAKKDDVALLIGGDPLVATTHTDLLLRARKAGVATRIIHNASVFSAVAETGLQVYKFGKTSTVVFWEKNYKPTSFYDVVRDNRKRGLHTLLFLDIKPPVFMSANDAIERLIDIDPKFSEEEVIVMARAGGDSAVYYGNAQKMSTHDFGPPLHILVVPGELHDMERDYLERYRV